MSHHSGMTICCSANIWSMSHNMYLIIRVTSMQRNTYHKRKYIYMKTSVYNKRTIYLFKAFKHNTNYNNKMMALQITSVASDTSHIKDYQNANYP
jgi:hypothetical protein